MSADPVASRATTSAAEPCRRLDPDPRVQRVERRQCGGQPGRRAGRGGDAGDPAAPAGVLLHGGAGVVHAGEDRLGARDELGARRGQLHAGGQAQQECHAQLLLQPAHLL